MKKAVFVLLIFTFTGCGSNDDVKNYMPGQSFLGSNGYIEYLAGDYPIIISVPHGGDLEPESLPDRDCEGCLYNKDNYTLEIALGIQQSFYELTGKYIHVIINKLHRRKLDANREIEEATGGHEVTRKFWNEFHDFTQYAVNVSERDFKKGLYIDLHGHAHDIQRIELGYLMDGETLQLSDATLNTTDYVESSALRNLANANLGDRTHAELLRGAYSLGTLMSNHNIPAVPSTGIPYPEVGDPFFSGGYNTLQYGSAGGGTVDGVQIECHYDIRHDDNLREEFISAMTEILVVYMEQHYFSE